jgi:MFS family permease
LAAAALAGVGGGLIWSNASPFMMAHTGESSRATVFSLQAALGTLTGFVAFMVGGRLPAFFSSVSGQPPDSLAVMRDIMLFAVFFYALSLLPIYLAGRIGKEAASAKAELQDEAARARTLKGGKLISQPGLFVRLLLPGVLVGLGAGMTMPFMNLYIERKFNVSFENLGQIFAWTSVATAAALLVQPVIADRLGKVKSVVIVQGASLPFLLVLGYGEFFPLVVAALFARAALMNMGNPVFSAFSMEQVKEKERATFASMSASVWSLGWAAGSWLSGSLREAVGFLTGFNILFALMALLYVASMVLMWVWFVPQETRQRELEKALREREQAGAIAA